MTHPDFATFPDDAMLTPPEVAAYLRVGKDAAYALCHQEGFPAMRIGNGFKVPFWALKVWVAQQARCSYPQASETPQGLAKLRH